MMDALFRDLTVGEALILNEAVRLSSTKEVKWEDSRQRQ